MQRPVILEKRAEIIMLNLITVGSAPGQDGNNHLVVILAGHPD